MFEASQAVYAVLRAFEGRAAAASVVLPLAMVTSRLSISRRPGTNLRGRFRLHNMPCLGAQTTQIEFRLNSTKEVFFYFFVELIFRNYSENAFLVIHCLTNQMQIHIKY